MVNINPKKKSFFHGFNGENSSKRLAGFILVFGMLIISFYAIYKDASQASAVLIPLAGVAAACFGMTVFEKNKGGNQ